MRAEVKRMLAEPDTFWTDQFNNEDAIHGYMGIGRELVEQTGGRSTCSAARSARRGCSPVSRRALKAGGSAARIVALEPRSAPMLTEGHGGTHRVEGIAPGFVPPHLKPGVHDEARSVDEAEARVMAKRLAREEGIFAGTSTALNVVAALKLAKELGPGKTGRDRRGRHRPQISRGRSVFAAPAGLCNEPWWRGYDSGVAPVVPDSRKRIQSLPERGGVRNVADARTTLARRSCG